MEKFENRVARQGRIGRTATALASLWVATLLLASNVVAQNCGCGPDFCKGDSRYAGKLAAKKNAMKNAGYPSDLVALVDRDGACVARVEQSPDGFSLMTVTLQGVKTILEWAADQEEAARKQLISGQLKAYYKFNVRQRFACCGDPKAENAPDWDSDLGLSKGIAIACTKSGSSVACK
jgi:hypothetical protein